MSPFNSTLLTDSNALGVDSFPSSTNGALVVANADPDQGDMVFKRLMQWGMSIVAIAPVVAWAALVVPTS